MNYSEYLSNQNIESGCSLDRIVQSMFNEQKEHNFATFGETYLKVIIIFNYKSNIFCYN